MGGLQAHPGASGHGPLGLMGIVSRRLLQGTVSATAQAQRRRVGRFIFLALLHAGDS